MARRSQHYMFAYEALIALWSTQSSPFIDLLNRDGVKFLRFWWDNTAMRVKPEDLGPSTGLDYEIRDLEDGRTLVLITMPKPHVVPEAYYLALVSAPPQRSFFPWQNFAHVFALEYDDSSTSTGLTASFSEWTRRGRQVPIKRGLAVDRQVLVDETLAQVMKGRNKASA